MTVLLLTEPVNIKAGLNYAMSLYPTTWAHERACRQYVSDSGSHHVEESSAQTSSLLIKREPWLFHCLGHRFHFASLSVAFNDVKDLLGMKVIAGPVRFDELRPVWLSAVCAVLLLLFLLLAKLLTARKRLFLVLVWEAVGPVMSAQQHADQHSVWRD